MPCIWGQHNGAQLFCPVVILPPSTQVSGGLVPGPHQSVNALIDTGANTTGLASTLVARLQMQPIGMMPIHGVAGTQHHNMHLFLVGFPFALPPGVPLPSGVPPLPPGQTAIQLHVLQKPITGCEFHAAAAPGGNPAFEVLLGMDVLSIGSLVVQGNHTFSFSF